MESAVETSFYPNDSDVYAMKERMRNMKKSMTLDLDPAYPNKKPRFALLSSPDLNMLKLGSPELEKLIIQQQNGHVTTTPTPTQFLFPRNVTEEQEMYARGFVDALAELHHSNPSSEAPLTTSDGGTTTSGTNGMYGDIPLSMSAALARATATNSNSATYAPITTTTTVSTGGGGRATNFLPVTIKEEPQTVPSGCSSPPMSPIDLQVQERIKLERKRQRNRLAASKCRRRKLERIAKLEDKVKLLKEENGDLSVVVGKLKDTICGLKEQLMDHVNNGCQILTASQYLS